MPYYLRGAAFAIGVSFQIGVWSGKRTSLNFLIATFSPNALSLAPRPVRGRRFLPGARCHSSPPDLTRNKSRLNNATMCDGQVLNVGIVTFSFVILIMSIANADPVLHDVPVSRHPIATD
jgi:hypothetical protein